MKRFLFLKIGLILAGFGWFSCEKMPETPPECLLLERSEFLPIEVTDTLAGSPKPNSQLFTGGLTRLESRQPPADDPCGGSWKCSGGGFGCTGVSFQKLRLTVGVGSEEIEFEIEGFQSFEKKNVAGFCENPTCRLLKVEYL